MTDDAKELLTKIGKIILYISAIIYFILFSGEETTLRYAI